jgi:hypothetical protein
MIPPDKTKRFFLVYILLLWASCYTVPVKAQVLQDSAESSIKMDTVTADSVDYELIVLDPAYESFLVTQPPAAHYSKQYYKSWNRQYVSEWNYRYRAGPADGLYENSIDYGPAIDYDIELEYRLYYFFRFFETKHNVRLINRSR